MVYQSAEPRVEPTRGELGFFLNLTPLAVHTGVRRPGGSKRRGEVRLGRLIIK